MRLFIIIVLGLVFAIAAFAGAYFVMGGKWPNSAPMTELSPPAESVIEHFPVELGSLPIPIYRGRFITGFTFVKVTYILRGDYDEAYLDPYLPIFKDTFIRKYFKELAPMTRDGLNVDYRRIEKDMQKFVDDLFLPGLVLDTKAEFSPG